MISELWVIIGVILSLIGLSRFIDLEKRLYKGLKLLEILPCDTIYYCGLIVTIIRILIFISLIFVGVKYCIIPNL